MQQTLRPLANHLRRLILELSCKTKTSHIGSCLSCADVLCAAYHGGMNISPNNVVAPLRDRVLLSKGHAAVALFCVLAQCGFFDFSHLLQHFNQAGGIQEHPNYRCLPGVENASGSLGHALPMGVGMALTAKIRQEHWRTCVIMGDGEINEGSVWEAAMFAAAHKLGSLCAVIDCNRWQGTGRSFDVMALEPLADKWRAFGWETVDMDGHDPDQLRDVLAGFGKGEKPLAIIARTVKGKGVSFMEDDNNWHYRKLTDAELARACEELA